MAVASKDNVFTKPSKDLSIGERGHPHHAPSRGRCIGWSKKTHIVASPALAVKVLECRYLSRRHILSRPRSTSSMISGHRSCG